LVVAVVKGDLPDVDGTGHTSASFEVGAGELVRDAIAPEADAPGGAGSGCEEEGEDGSRVHGGDG
jgi:hypothetical protein